MTRWPLLLPPPAVSTSPSRLRRSLSFIVVKSPSRRSSPSSCRRAVHHRPFTIALSIAAHRRCALSPSPPLLRRPLPSRSRRAPSLAIEEPSRRPSTSRSRRVVPRRLGAAASSLAVKEPLRRSLPSMSRRAVSHHQGAVGRVD
jgi:hypothetical protein